MSSKVTKTINIYTNIPGADANVKIKMQGELWQPVQVSPRSASFSRLSSEQAKSGLVRKLTVVNNVEGMAELTNVRSSHPAFSVETKTIEPGKKFELIVTLVPPLKPGRNSGKIEFSTGISDKPTMSVPVSAFVTAEIDVMPPKLAVASERTKDLSRQFTIRNYSKKPVKITDLVTSNPALKVAMTETKAGMNFRVTVTVPATYVIPAGGDKITFKTDCPAVPEVTVPIIARSTRRKITSAKSNPMKIGPSSANRPSVRAIAPPKKLSAGTTDKKATPAGQKPTAKDAVTAPKPQTGKESSKQ